MKTVAPGAKIVVIFLALLAVSLAPKRKQTVDTFIRAFIEDFSDGNNHLVTLYSKRRNGVIS